MHLIDDVHFKFSFRRGIRDLIHDFTDVVHAIVGSRVNFYHIHAGTGSDCAAGRAFSAGTSIHRMFAVDTSGKQLCNGSFSRSSCAAEQICMTDTVRLNLILQSCHDRVLSFHFFKTGRTESSVHRCIRHEKNLQFYRFPNGRLPPCRKQTLKFPASHPAGNQTDQLWFSHRS